MTEEKQKKEVTLEEICEHFQKTPEQISNMLIRAGLVNRNQYKQLIQQYELEQEAMRKTVNRNKTFIEYVETELKVKKLNDPTFPTSVEEIEELQKRITDINNEWAERLAAEIKKKDEILFSLSNDHAVAKDLIDQLNKKITELQKPWYKRI